MKRAATTSTILSLLLFGLVGCASTGTAPTADAPEAADSSEDEARDLEDLEHKIHIHRARMNVTKMEHAAAEKAHAIRMKHAEVELEMAKATLAKFDDLDAPNLLAMEKLGLQSAKDSTREAAEELAQIEIMYKDQDLDDVTAEFVVSRGRRRAERAAARLAIQESELKALAERELPQQRKQLALALDRAAESLNELRRSGDIDASKRAIEMEESVNGLKELERELAEMREGDDQ